MLKLYVFNLRSVLNKCVWPKYSTSPISLSNPQPSEQQVEDPDKPVFDLENPFEREKKQCLLCKHKIPVDYKNVKLLSQFVSPYTGGLYGKHITGLCETQHRRVESAVAMSRKLGYMAYMFKSLKYVKDPKLYDPFNPTRPHPH